MYSYCYLDLTLRASLPPAAPSTPLRMLNSKIGTDAYEEVEGLNDIVVRPEN